jgi:hypothetical protein
MEIYLGSPDFTLIDLRKNYSSQFIGQDISFKFGFADQHYLQYSNINVHRIISEFGKDDRHSFGYALNIFCTRTLFWD